LSASALYLAFVLRSGRSSPWPAPGPPARSSLRGPDFYCDINRHCAAQDSAFHYSRLLFRARFSVMAATKAFDPERLAEEDGIIAEAFAHSGFSGRALIVMIGMWA
jgi:hypothetical protein